MKLLVSFGNSRMLHSGVWLKWSKVRGELHRRKVHMAGMQGSVVSLCHYVTLDYTLSEDRIHWKKLNGNYLNMIYCLK
jgi:hypothetical protein